MGRSSSLGRGKTDLLHASSLAGIHDCGHLLEWRAGVGTNDNRRVLLGGKLCEPSGQLTRTTLLSRDSHCAIVSNGDSNRLLRGVGAANEGERYRNARYGPDDVSQCVVWLMVMV